MEEVFLVNSYRGIVYRSGLKKMILTEFNQPLAANERRYLRRTGDFTITKLLPPVGAELQYRVKNEHEGHERVASEHEPMSWRWKNRSLWADRDCRRWKTQRAFFARFP